MRIPTPLLAANFVLAAAICAAIFALGLWLFVLNNKTLNTVENTVEKSAIHGTIRQMEQPIQLEEFGMASMGDGKKHQ
uniref:Col_cuticle_N domain-containing protein n=1 Tax=Globodera pallida TaxID=36090 RepID=A0A183BUC7_GLOPA